MIDVSHCAGCRNDFYNCHNNLGVKQCWMLKHATLINTVLVHVDAPPPYLDLETKQRPHCYKAERFVTAQPKDIDSKGYWAR